jgi:hypothetical protein
VNDLQAAVTWLGKGKASGQGEASEREIADRITAPLRV